MAKVAIVYHSGFGHTRVQAEAVHRGASRVKDVDAILIPIEEYEEKHALEQHDRVLHCLVGPRNLGDGRRQGVQRQAEDCGLDVFREHNIG